MGRGLSLLLGLSLVVGLSLVMDLPLVLGVLIKYFTGAVSRVSIKIKWQMINAFPLLGRGRFITSCFAMTFSEGADA